MINQYTVTVETTDTVIASEKPNRVMINIGKQGTNTISFNFGAPAVNQQGINLSTAFGGVRFGRWEMGSAIGAEIHAISNVASQIVHVLEILEAP